MARSLDAIPLSGPAVPLNSCYVIATSSADEAEALAAYLRTPIVTAIARLGAEPARGGFARFGARVIRQLPLPASVATDDILRAAGRQPHDRELARAASARTATLLALDAADVDGLLATHRG